MAVVVAVNVVQVAAAVFVAVTVVVAAAGGSAVVSVSVDDAGVSLDGGRNCEPQDADDLFLIGVAAGVVVADAVLFRVA